MRIENFFARHPRVALAFSGGADSAYLLYEAMRCRADVRAYFVKTEFQPEFELVDAKRLAAELGVNLTIINASVLGDEAIVSNPSDRCYHCKKKIFAQLLERATADGFDVVIDGTNASDDSSDRPGMRALRQLGVLSPLRDCGITKTELRKRSAEAGLFTHDKPSYSCLATRIPTGEEISAEQLKAVESAEDSLFKMGFSDLRVRMDGDTARLELPGAQMSEAIEKREQICRALGKYFKNVVLDLEGR